MAKKRIVVTDIIEHDTPSNIRSVDAFTSDNLRPFGEDGYSLVYTNEKGKEKPILEPLGEILVRTGSGWPEDPTDLLNEPVAEDDLDQLVLRGVSTGLSLEYLRTAVTNQGTDLDMAVALLRKEIEQRETDCLVDLSEATRCYDAVTMIQRVGNYAVSNALAKSPEDYFLNLWRAATAVYIDQHSSGLTEITLMDSRRHQFTMSVEDFAELMAIPALNNGNSMVYLPSAGSKTDYEKIFTKLSLFGYYLGDGNMPKFTVITEAGDDKLFMQEYLAIVCAESKPWHIFLI